MLALRICPHVFKLQFSRVQTKQGGSWMVCHQIRPRWMLKIIPDCLARMGVRCQKASVESGSVISFLSNDFFFGSQHQQFHQKLTTSGRSIKNAQANTRIHLYPLQLVYLLLSSPDGFALLRIQVMKHQARSFYAEVMGRLGRGLLHFISWLHHCCLVTKGGKNRSDWKQALSLGKLPIDFRDYSFSLDGVQIVVVSTILSASPKHRTPED